MDTRPPPPSLAHSIRRVLTAQAALAVLLVALVLLATHLAGGAGLAQAKAAAFGALLGILATGATARSVVKSSRAAAENPHLGLLPVYGGLLLKIVIVAGGAFLGMVQWKLGPLYVALGYITMQAGYAWAAPVTTSAGVGEKTVPKNTHHGSIRDNRTHPR